MDATGGVKVPFARCIAAEHLGCVIRVERWRDARYEEDKGLVLRRYWTNACQRCAIKHSCTTGKERLIMIYRWEHEHILEAMHQLLAKTTRDMQPRPKRSYAQ